MSYSPFVSPLEGGIVVLVHVSKGDSDLCVSDPVVFWGEVLLEPGAISESEDFEGWILVSDVVVGLRVCLPLELWYGLCPLYCALSAVGGD